MEPSGGLPFYSSGGILSNVKVFEIKSGNLVKSMSVYAANSDSLSYNQSNHKYTLGLQDVTKQNLFDNYWTMMVGQLNAVCQ